MGYKVKEIKEGVKLHIIDNNKFKTNLIAIFLTTPISRKYVTYDAVLSSVLRRGSKNMPTQEIISKELENMYGASFDCGLDKTGDNHVLKFYLETINDKFIPQNDENMLKEGIEKILDIVFNPLIENNSFKEEYVNQEKQTIKQIIEGKKDNKARFALDRCIEEMYKDKPFGLYKFGYVEDLENINASNLYEYFNKLKDECKIDIFISGNCDDKIEELVINNENITNLNERKPNYVLGSLEKDDLDKTENIVKESMEVTQGKLVLGLDIDIQDEESKYKALVYNGILGATPSSKLFQNVREKASLAYSASSSYLRYKNNIFINCGIEINNYDKALEIIKKQLEDMRSGNFTDEDILNSKNNIISTIKNISDEQDTEVVYYLGQELTNNRVSVEEYINKIENVNKEDIINIANSTTINTIYFLKD